MPSQQGIKKLENGRYQARYFAGFDSKGKRRYPSRTFDLQSEAIRWRSARVDEKSSGRHFEIHNLTVAQYLDRWLGSKKQVLRENSWEMYRQYLSDYVKLQIGHIKLSRLRPTHIEVRHSFVTFSLLAGVDIKTVSQEAGHASVAFTLDHYGHVLKEMHEAASDKREQLLKSRAATRGDHARVMHTGIEKSRISLGHLTTDDRSSICRNLRVMV